MKVGIFDDAALWSLFGFLLGAAGIGLLVMFPMLESYIDFIKNYQSLIGALLALGGALLTVIIIAIQIQSAQQAEVQRKHDKLRAAKAVLPLALAEISEYAKTNLQILLPLLPLLDDKDGIPQYPSSQLQFVDIPTGTLQILRDCIEASGAENGEALSELPAKMQIFSSRSQSLSAKMFHRIEEIHRSILDTFQIRRMIMDFLHLYVLAGKYYDYGRGKTNYILNSVRYNDMINGALNCELFDQYPTLMKVIGGEYDTATTASHVTFS